MVITYVKAESTTKPNVVSVEKTTVYLRRNIFEDVRMKNDIPTTYYTYEEAALTHDEFSKYCEEAVATSAVNINELVNNGADSTNNQLILMEAIADLYDAIANMM